MARTSAALAWLRADIRGASADQARRTISHLHIFISLTNIAPEDARRFDFIFVAIHRASRYWPAKISKLRALPGLAPIQISVTGRREQIAWNEETLRVQRNLEWAKQSPPIRNYRCRIQTPVRGCRHHIWVSVISRALSDLAKSYPPGPSASKSTVAHEPEQVERRRRANADHAVVASAWDLNSVTTIHCRVFSRQQPACDIERHVLFAFTRETADSRG